MHARELADLAILVSIHGREFIRTSPLVVDEALESYWTASRCRLDRWCRGLRALTQSASSNQLRRWPRESILLVEEVLVSELLTRSFAAVLAAHDRLHDRKESDPIGRNILSGHLDAQRRALRLIASPAFASTPQAGFLEQLHDRTGCWTDLLLACLATETPIDDFAIRPERARELAADMSRYAHSSSTRASAVALLSAGLHDSLEETLDGPSPNADLNQQIAASVLGCIDPEFFDSYGLLRSLWMQRLDSVPDETLALLDQWWQPPPSGPTHFSTRWQS